uniref:Cytochrome c oxidase subunit n=1 Tax=Riftia pachyptila TaxID=6426 RepID=A8ST02_RIFPA|nr:cytochrome c oxidase subunit [Riftia pachyptila]
MHCMILLLINYTPALQCIDDKTWQETNVFCFYSVEKNIVIRVIACFTISFMNFFYNIHVYTMWTNLLIVLVMRCRFRY